MKTKKGIRVHLSSLSFISSFQIHHKCTRFDIGTSSQPYTFSCLRPRKWHQFFTLQPQSPNKLKIEGLFLIYKNQRHQEMRIIYLPLKASISLKLAPNKLFSSVLFPKHIILYIKKPIRIYQETIKRREYINLSSNIQMYRSKHKGWIIKLKFTSKNTVAEHQL